MWWDRSGILSHNKIFNMVLSNRGGGKTFNCTRWAIDDFKKNGRQAVWVRRYQTEVDAMIAKDKFFDAVREFYPNDKLEIVTEDKLTFGLINGEVAIHFVALSTSRQLKSNNYPLVNKIIFDEFIIDKGRITYLKNEVEVFLDLYETVDRLRDETRAVLLANSVTIVNPYFLFWNIKPNTTKRFTVKGEACVELFTDADFVAKKKESRFGKLVAGTRYADYAIDNKWLLDNETFIQKKSKKAEFMLAMKYCGVYYGFWVDYDMGLMFVNRQYDPSSYSLYCLTKDDHEANLLLIKSLGDSKRIQRIVYAFRNGLIRFEDMQVKNQFYEFIGFFVR